MFKNKLLILFLSIFVMPLSVFAYPKYLIPGGESVGITIASNGIIVVGFYPVNDKYIAVQSGLEVGDKIVTINDKKITSIEELVNSISFDNDMVDIVIGYERDGKFLKAKLSLEKDSSGIFKTGIYVKDSITGIGTLTFIDPSNNTYGALGHEIIEKTSQYKIDVKNGNIFKSIVTGIKKNTTNGVGEKNAKFISSDIYGSVLINDITGIFGNYTSDLPDKDLMEVASNNEIVVGKASILTVLSGDKIERFDINIISLDKNNETKNILFKVTDEKLLNITGGIIQGMSGSPIIQNNMIVGAVTHVIVDDSTKGYGIFITKMLDSIE